MRRNFTLAIAFTLLTLTPSIAAAQTSAPFKKFNVFAVGPIATSNNLSNCPEVQCASGFCISCGTFSDLTINGLAGATLSGELLLELGNSVGFTVGNCSQLHGISTATAKSFSIKFGIQGWACHDATLSPDHLQFSGNYVVLSGTGSYGHAAGTGSFTTDYPGSLETVTRSIVFDGVIQKAQ